MKYPKYIVDMAYYCLVVEEVSPDQIECWAQVDLECSIYESESGVTSEPGFESDWKNDLLEQVKQIHGYTKPV